MSKKHKKESREGNAAPKRNAAPKGNDVVQKDTSVLEYIGFFAVGTAVVYAASAAATVALGQAARYQI